MLSLRGRGGGSVESRGVTQPPDEESSRRADELARALADAREDTPGAAEALLSLVYDELRALAQSHLRKERPQHSLQATEIVHEAWLRVTSRADRHWEGREHFFAVAASAMRQLLVDHARRRSAEKRGGGLRRVTLADDLVSGGARELDVLDLHAALERLAKRSAVQARVVELRYFGGLTIAEVAAELGLGSTTVDEHWAVARAWLHRELQE